MRYGQHKDVCAILCVNHAVGKAPQTTAANVWSEWMPRLRMQRNQLNGFERFNQECFAQPRRLLCVPRYRFVQLGLRWR